MRKKRRFSTFNLAFLDIMSCGFGAVILVFLIIKHGNDDNINDVNKNLIAEVNLLQEEVIEGELTLTKSKNTVSDLDQRMKTAIGLARQINRDITTTQGQVKDLSQSSADDKLNQLKLDLLQLEKDKAQAEKENEQLGDNILRTLGQGDRQYLTGMKLGGSRILILVDSSASMLDETIVNIIRRRNMSDKIKISSPKWQRALAATAWISAQLPVNAYYQIYRFNTRVEAVIPGTEGLWLELNDGAELEQALINLSAKAPSKGTNLYKTFASLQNFEQLPDNIFIITDGLPTLGKNKSNSHTVDSNQRVKLFNKAQKILPSNIPVNVILLPMEGDPMAASAFWTLAQNSKGSFMSPSEDWP